MMYVDPDGREIHVTDFSTREQQQILDGLAAFTGNTYEIVEGQLVLSEIGASSEIATDFLNDLIDSTEVFGVERTSKGNRWDPVKDVSQINPTTFDGADYGDVDPATFNLGSTLVHELFHDKSGLGDDFGKPSPPTGDRLDWQGPAVTFVNTIRAERGLPLRRGHRVQKGKWAWTREKLHLVGFSVQGQRGYKNVKRLNYWQ